MFSGWYKLFTKIRYKRQKTLFADDTVLFGNLNNNSVNTLDKVKSWLIEHNRRDGRDKSGCNAGWAYIGMLTKCLLVVHRNYSVT